MGDVEVALSGLCILYSWAAEIILVWSELMSASSKLASEHVLRLILQVDATGLSIENAEGMVDSTFSSLFNQRTSILLTPPPRIDASLFSSSSFSSPPH